MNYRRHDCKNQGKAVPAYRKGEPRELDYCFRKDWCGRKIHSNGKIFCGASPLFEGIIVKKENTTEASDGK